jgi:nucleotide-binding universal stress UspA family protein
MKKALLVIPARADAPNAIAYAVGRAKDAGGDLLAVVVLDPNVTQRIAETLTDQAFVGEEVSQNVADTVAKEQRVQAEDLLNQIAEQAKNAGVACSPLIEEGDPSEICTRLIRTHNVQSAVLVAEKRSWLTRFLSRAAAVKLPALAGCEVKVMDD